MTFLNYANRRSKRGIKGKIPKDSGLLDHVLLFEIK